MCIQTMKARELVLCIEKEFKSNRAFVLWVTGHSMRPLLRHLKDRVVLVSPEQRKPGKNDIVFVQRANGSCVLHRIIEILGKNEFLINGDAQIWTEIIDEKQIVGVVSTVIRKSRWVSCDSYRYQCYVRIWERLRPLRRYMIAIDDMAYRKLRKWR